MDFINGVPGHELKCDNRRLVTNYLRVGYDEDGAWRTFGLRKDFYPASKLAFEDDITASITVPRSSLENLDPAYQNLSLKFVKNCEQRLFQRPDDAIHPGYDKQTEADFAKSGNFFSNYEALTSADAKDLLEDTIGFDQFTLPMQQLIRQSATGGNGAYFVSSANPRIVDGKPSKNPRYLQLRPDLVHPRDAYLAEMGARLSRRIPAGPCPAQAGECRPPWSPQQSARRRNPALGRFQSDSLPGTARTLHGVHLQRHRKISFHDRCRFRRCAHQGALQRPASDYRSQRCACLLPAHR